MTVQIVPALDIPFDVFTYLLNTSYRDYYVPLDMNETQLRDRIARDDISMEASRVALVDEQPVGLGMLAMRDTRGWIGGVGVLPGHRQQGIGRELMNALLDEARRHHIEQLQLEVIRQNTAARALYDSLGFQQSRMLHVAEGYARAGVEGYKFQDIPPLKALRYFEAFHPQPNPWQREKSALVQLAPEVTATIAIQGDKVVAYAMGVFNPTVIRFVDLAYAPRQQASLRALVGELHRRHPLAAGSIINIAEQDPAWAVLFALGYKPFLSQYEMTLAF